MNLGQKIVGLIGLGVLCAATAVAVEPPQAAVKYSVANPQIHETESPGPPLFFSDACPATDVGMLASDGSVTIPGDTCGSANDFEHFPFVCHSYGWYGLDEIFQFTVQENGVWQLDTSTICAGWDTSLMVREETGGGCPGDFVACDDDDGHGTCGNYESVLLAFLTSGTTYYIVVDGYSSATCGPFEVSAFLVQPACTSDGDCTDGLFCTGEEVCNLGTGECLPGDPPCPSYKLCDEEADACIEPDPCISWLGGVSSDYFFPYADYTPGTWIADDIELERGCTTVPSFLNYYDLPIIARPAENPVGAPYYLDVALWTVEEFTCKPLAQIAGSQCLGLSDNIDAAGSPADILHCEPGSVPLPDNSGDFNRCEIDFFVGYLGTDLGVGFSIAASEQIVGELAAEDDFGINVFFLEEYPGAGTWGVPWYFDDYEAFRADFAKLTVCTVNLGVCCEGNDTCTEVPEMDCAGTWTPCVFWDPVSCTADTDGDGVSICSDNCPGIWNPGQEDCDDGITPEGDVCELDWDFGDYDRDGWCNGFERCPYDPNKIDPGICGCGVSDVDTDGDGVADCLDPCPQDPNKVYPGQCGCGVPDTDTDGDGVADCNDQCPGVDDAVFAPRCEGAIPTVSQWGLIILALLLLVVGKVYFGRRPAMR